MKKLPFFSFVWLLLISSLAAQTPDSKSQQNIVPNSSFEKFSGTPIGWYYKGAHFDNVMQYWKSPTSTSPDIFGKGVRVPNTWHSKGFGDLAAQDGERFVGITLYGCSNGKPHCREYLQIQLKEPLVIGQKYAVSYYISHLPRSMYCNNMGIHFSDKQYEYKIEQHLDFSTETKEEKVVVVSAKKWKKIKHEFIAEEASSYLIIGNFDTDEQTQVSQTAKQDFNYAYYYFDNISVIKQRPIITVPAQPNTLLANTIQAGEIIVLKDIFFDLNKSDLLPRSYRTLENLIVLMQNSPNLKIEIRGHTDNQGSSDYNQELSLKRAASVVDYLYIHGDIDRSRLKFIGYGDSNPVSSNESLDGRQQNRRVEFLVLSN